MLYSDCCLWQVAAVAWVGSSQHVRVCNSVRFVSDPLKLLHVYGRDRTRLRSSLHMLHHEMEKFLDQQLLAIITLLIVECFLTWHGLGCEITDA